MKLRELESHLGHVSTFSTPVIELEQYPTSAHLAAQILHVASSHEDIFDRSVLDLGCGGGILGVGACLLGSPHVTGVDIDTGALAIATANASALDVGDSIEFVHADVGTFSPLIPTHDTVLMNPPFGTKRRGIDICFLQVAIEHAYGAVYSLHKSSTREFIASKARSWGAEAAVLAELRFDIPAMYAFHKSASVDVAVDLWRFDCFGRARMALRDPREWVRGDSSVPRKIDGKVGGRGRSGGKGRGKGRRGGRG